MERKVTRNIFKALSLASLSLSVDAALPAFSASGSSAFAQSKTIGSPDKVARKRIRKLSKQVALIDSQVRTKAAKGDKGDNGEMGPAGIQGIQGVAGPQGLNGSAGAPGAQGERGLQGVQGLQGQRGQDGAAGTQGPAGESGLQGERGEQGPQGETGPQGPVGPAGERGETGAAGSDAYVAKLHFDLNPNQCVKANLQPLCGDAGGCRYVITNRRASDGEVLTFSATLAFGDIVPGTASRFVRTYWGSDNSGGGYGLKILTGPNAGPAYLIAPYGASAIENYRLGGAGCGGTNQNPEVNPYDIWFRSAVGWTTSVDIFDF